jgi:deoxyadenosine/deoxycytidine kinase
VDTLIKQISKRGRDFEQGIQRSYLEQLNKLYEDWIARYKLGPLLIIESDDLDFVNNPVDLNYILARVKYRLPQMLLFE